MRTLTAIIGSAVILAALSFAAGRATVAVPFGTRHGDCPAEDVCRADYDGPTQRWTIVPVTP